MQGSTKELTENAKTLSLNIISTHYMIHREALVVKRLMQENTTQSGFEIDLHRCHKNCEFHPLIFKKGPNVFRNVQRYGSRRNEVTTSF